jgi:hypothetical protein
VIEELVEQVILERLIKLSSDRKDAIFYRMGAPLSSFSAKIEMAYALGIIANELRLTLHLIREIRNKFAHEIEALTFDHHEVAELIDTRASQHIKNLTVSRRDKFMSMFNATAIILVGTWAADMRIKPLEETHAEHFVHWFAYALGQAREPVPPIEESTPPPDHQPKPR